MSSEHQATKPTALGDNAPEPLADRESRNPLLRYLLHLGLPLSASLLIHIAVLLFAASYGIRLLVPDAVSRRPSRRMGSTGPSRPPPRSPSMSRRTMCSKAWPRCRGPRTWT